MSDDLLLTSEDLRIVIDALVYTGNNDESKDQAQKMMIADMIRALSGGIEDLTVDDYNSVLSFADAIENGGGVSLPVLKPPP